MTKHVLCYLLIVLLINVGTIKAGHQHIPTATDVQPSKSRDLEIGVRGHSRSLKVLPFDRLCMVSY